MNDANDGPNADGGLSAYKIRRHLEGTLRRLQTDHVELYQMHHVDRNATWEELWDVFQAVVQEGKVYYIGASNFAGWHLMKAQAAAKARNFLGLVAEQHKYNLLCRLPELEVLPAALDQGIGVIPWSPLAGGLLGGNALKKLAGSRSGQGWAAEEAQQKRETLEAFSKLAQEMGKKEADIALAWLIQNPAVTAPIIGPRTEDQLVDSLGALEVSFTPENLAQLEAIFPGPGKPAPEAYAW